MGEMNRMLMCGDRLVMEFEYSRSGGYALWAGTIHDSARVPTGMWVDSSPEPTGESITRWWRSRGIIHDQLATNRHINHAGRIGMIRERRDATAAPLLVSPFNFGGDAIDAGRTR